MRRFAVHSLDREHLELLHRMTEELEVLRLHGHRVGVVVCELGSFVDELAPLVSRCLELFDLPLLFAIFGEGDRATVIARGQLEGFHLGQALAAVAGGGGHETAAAGSVKGATALEVRERLLAYLDGALPPVARARDLMIAPFVAVEAAATVAQAKERLVRARINAAPVVDGGRRRRRRDAPAARRRPAARARRAAGDDGDAPGARVGAARRAGRGAGPPHGRAAPALRAGGRRRRRPRRSGW